jgi:hypothetical protein
MPIVFLSGGAMTNHASEMSAEFLCDWCGYDLRAHPLDGKCPECGASVAESKRLAANPRRPAWRDSDPRWRRRILAGVWLLVLLPLKDLLTGCGWASSVSVPNVFKFPGALSLDETFICTRNVYASLIFCIGIVLLFSRERGRRHSRLDWTRRWGVLCSYVVLLLSAAPILIISALVLVGISAVFLSMPLKYQPGATQFFVEVSTTYLCHGPSPKDIAIVVLVAFSSIAILLACVPLFDALRSSGSKWFAAVILAPLPLFSLMNLAQAARYCINPSTANSENVSQYAVYFWPQLMGEHIASLAHLDFSGLAIGVYLIETTKWCVVLTIAVWLSVAQLATWRRRKKTSGDVTPLVAGIG